MLVSLHWHPFYWFISKFLTSISFFSDASQCQDHQPHRDLGHDLMMMEQPNRHGDDTDQDFLCNMDTFFLDTSDDELPKLQDSLFTRPRAATHRKQDPVSMKQQPVWVNFDNGDVFYSSTGEFPCASELSGEKDLCNSLPSSASCRLPYPKKWRNSPSSYFEEQSSSSSSHLSSRNSPPHHEEASSDAQLYKLRSALQDLQYQGVVGNGLVNPRPPVFALDEKACALCKKNGETREFYTTHVLKDNRGKIICPILRKYVCPTCGATGDNAHTLRHCPVNKASETAKHSYWGTKRLVKKHTACISVAVNIQWLFCIFIIFIIVWCTNWTDE